MTAKMNYNIEDFKVLILGVVGIASSFLKLDISVLEILRYVLVLTTIGYTLRKWYLLEINKRKNERN